MNNNNKYQYNTKYQNKQKKKSKECSDMQFKTCKKILKNQSYVEEKMENFDILNIIIDKNFYKY